MAKTFYKRPKRLDKLTKEEKLDLMYDLIYSFSKLKNPVDTAFFLQDLLTAGEIRNIAVRLRIAKLLLAGLTYREIQDELHVSFATVTKVSIWLDSGGEGFRKVIEKLPFRWEMPEKLPRKPIEFQLPQALLALTQYALARRQTKQIDYLESFLDELASKEKLDKNLQKDFDEYYRKAYREGKKLKLKKGV